MSDPLVLTPGDPLGIGPELTGRVLHAMAPAERRGIEVIGDRRAIEPHLLGLDVRCTWVDDAAEPVELAALRLAVDRCLNDGAALVTGPIHKAKLARRGFTYNGHTDFLAHLCGVDGPVMAFVGGRMRVALVTVHVPLSQVATVLTAPRIEHTLRVAHRALVDQVGLPNPTLVVCGLNPHAGDEGLLGREELDLIGPVVEACRIDGLDVRGPVSAESAFMEGQGGDLIVAMYHDQGLVPLKALDFGRTVNWTLGLPIIRTSVDHGTAYDLVGTGRARTSSLEAAVQWARDLQQRQRRPPP